MAGREEPFLSFQSLDGSLDHGSSRGVAWLSLGLGSLLGLWDLASTMLELLGFVLFG